MELLNYYPEFLKRSPEIIAICNAVQPELEELNNAAESVWNDNYIDSASEYGLSRREKMLGISPSDSIAQRRATLRNKYMEQRPFTEKCLIRYLDQILSSYTLEVNKESGNMFVKLTVGSGDAAPANLYEQLRAIVPANMAINTGDGSAIESVIVDEGEYMVIYSIGNDINVTDITDPTYGGLIDFGGTSV